MSGRRYDCILSSTALALILVAPLGAGAQDASKQNGKIAATFSDVGVSLMRARES